jgi:hypothetical protein
MKKTTLILLLLIPAMQILSQTDSLNIKKGWTLGLLPSVAFDSDLGFKYGGLVNFYNFGDGSTYPNYKHSIYLEIARTTKGGGLNQLFFDSGHLFKGKDIRVTADLSWLTEQALDFYGFNGAEAFYLPEVADENSSDYISRMFYRHERKMLRAYADFQGNITSKKFRWLAGGAFYGYQIGTVDIDRLNKGKDPEDLLPDTVTLYDLCVENNIIPENEADGGNLKLLKVGLIYDTRDIEANPSKGIWTEAIVMTAPRFFGNTENAFTKLVVTHRQYFTLLEDRLSFVYRIGYQSTIDGNAPFYFQPLLISSYSPSTITEGLGGAKSLRGIMRNRLVGDGITYGNFEFRYKIFKFIAAKQNVYIALNPFMDAGMIVKRIESWGTTTGTALDNYYNSSEETIHLTAGCGLHLALNENFVLAINYGRALNAQDGKSGLYIGTNWLF